MSHPFRGLLARLEPPAEAMAAIGPDEEFTVALDDVIARGALIELCFLHLRSSLRCFLQDCSISRKRAYALPARQTKRGSENQSSQRCSHEVSFPDFTCFLPGIREKEVRNPSAQDCRRTGSLSRLCNVRLPINPLKKSGRAAPAVNW